MPQQQKYEVRFCNGMWGQFDTYNYRTVESYHRKDDEYFPLRVEVAAAVEEANKKFLQRRQ